MRGRASFRSPFRLRVALLLAVLLGVWTTSPRVARADDCPNDSRTCAATFFEAGRKLLEAGDCSSAIPVFRKSLAYQPSVGTRLNLADCYVKTNAVVDAYNQYAAGIRLAASTADPRRGLCETGAAALEHGVLRVRLVMAKPDGLDGIDVRVDGTLLSSAEVDLLTGAAFALQPDKAHTLEVTGGRWKPWNKMIEGPAGGPMEVQVNLEAVAAPVVPPSPAPAGPVPPPAAERPSGGSSQRTLGLVIGGVGIAGVVAGGIAGGVAIAKKNQVDDLCPAGLSRCPSSSAAAQVRSPNDAANHAALASDIALGVGVAALAAGVILYFTAPSARQASAAALRVSPSVGPGSAGVSVGGAF